MSEINKDITFGNLIRQYPQSASLLGKYGLHCVGCHIGAFETLEQGMKAHGLDDNAIETLVQELKQLAN